MREVDFRPEWYVRSLADRAGARVHVTGFIVVASLLLVWWADATARSRAATVSVGRLDRAMSAQDAMVEHLDALEREIGRQRRDLNLLAELNGDVAVAGLLAELSHMTPPSLTLRSLVLDRAPRVQPVPQKDAKEGPEPPKRTQLELSGWAASGEDIANLVRAMAESPLFVNVTLGYEHAETVSGRRVVAFKVVCQMPQFE